VGLIIVRYPAIRLLYQHGAFTPADTIWVARSTIFFAAAIWAFSLQQILNRGLLRAARHHHAADHVDRDHPCEHGGGNSRWSSRTLANPAWRQARWRVFRFRRL